MNQHPEDSSASLRGGDGASASPGARGLFALPDAVARFVVGRPTIVLTILGLLTAAAGALAWQVRFDFTPQSIFSGRDQLVSYAEQFKKDFGYDDAVVIIGLESPADRDVLTPESLTWQATVVREFEALPHVVRVESLISMKRPRVTLSLNPNVSYLPIIDEVPVTEDRAARLREALDRSILPFGSLIHRDRKTAALLVVFDPARRDFEAMRDMVATVDDLLARSPPPPGFQLYVSGLPVLRSDIVKNLQADQMRLMPIAGAIYLLTLAIVFRSASGSLLPLFAVLQGLAWTFAVIVLRGQPLNIVSNILPAMLLINGVSNAVHVLSRYAEEAMHTPGDLRRAARKTVAQMIVACLGTFSTTAAGFLSLWSARSSVLQDFGTQAAVGLIFLYVTVIFTLGAAFPYMKPPTFRQAGRMSDWISSGLGNAGQWIVARPRLVVGVFVALAVLFVVLARNIEVNSTTIETYDDDHPTIRTIRTLETRLSGLLPLEISLEADDPETFYRLDVARKVAELKRFAEDQAPVLFTRTYLDFLDEINLRFAESDARRTELTEAERGQRALDRGRRFVNRVAEEMRYHDFMRDDALRARMLLKIRDVGTRDTLKLVRTLEDKLAELFPPGSGVAARVTGDAYVNARALDGLIRDLIMSIFTASLVIFGIIAALFRSIRVGLITVPPNVVPLLMTLGYMGLRGYDMNAGNVIVFTISLGIAVDNNIHYLLRFREEYAHRPDLLLATRRTLTGAGLAMVLSTMLIVIGLAVLLFSDFVPTRRFAELTLVTLVSALLGALILLPACVRLLWRRKPGA